MKPVAGREGFALDGGIIGRSDDLVVVRGVNLYPSSVEAVVREAGLAGEYRVRVDRGAAMTEVSLEVEGTGEDAARVEASLRSAFSLRIPVVVRPDGEELGWPFTPTELGVFCSGCER